MQPSTVSVVLGPSPDLHPGVHDSLLSNPPHGITYKISDADHSFPFLTPCVSPHENFHLGEFVRFPIRARIVHSSRWPVLHSTGWVADTDDFGYQMLCGRHALNPNFRHAFSADWTPTLFRSIKARTENMLTAFAHPSCKGILFRSDYALREAEEWIKRLEFDLLGSSFMAKSHVLYPAQKPCGPDIVSHKWRQDSPLRVVFCGHDYETKNGAMALRILSKVAQDLRVTCIYVGHIPRAEKGRCSDLLKNLEVFESIPRPTILKMFSEAHVLFHPSKFEGLGTVLLEAAAAAMAVVVGRGRGMSHINEVFGDDGALYVDRDFVEPEDEERAFEHGLRFVLDNRSVAREMATRNYHTAVSGRYSLDRRDKVLNNVYGEILDAPASRPLELVELPHTIPHAIKSLTSAQVREDEKVYKARLGLKQDRLLIETNR